MYRHHTTRKNARNLKSVSRAKQLEFKAIFRFLKHDHQEIDSKIDQFSDLAVLCMKQSWNGFYILGIFQCCMRSIVNTISREPSKKWFVTSTKYSIFISGFLWFLLLIWFINGPNIQIRLVILLTRALQPNMTFTSTKYSIFILGFLFGINTCKSNTKK